MLHAPSPSRFTIVSLLVLLMLGVGVNLYIAHWDPFSANPTATPNKRFTTDSPSPSDPVRWPTIPDEIDDDLGTPKRWILISFNTHQRLHIKLFTNAAIYQLEEVRFGAPLTARSTKIIWQSNTNAGIWPMEGNKYVGPAITYHPLGLIINPIVYALPIWFVLLLIRYMLVSYKLRNRIAQGLCLQCAYDIQYLPICPECGTAVEVASVTPDATG